MDRRTFLKSVGSTALAAGLATPAISQRAAARTIRFVPQADLSNFDPVWSSTVVVRNASVMVFDMLYGIDENLTPQRQMIEAEEVSSDAPGRSACAPGSNGTMASRCSPGTASQALPAGRCATRWGR